MVLVLLTSLHFPESGLKRFLFAAKPLISEGLLDLYLIIVFTGRQMVDFFSVANISFNRTIGIWLRGTGRGEDTSVCCFSFYESSFQFT